MSFAGVFDLFRGRPRDAVGEGGRMSLGDHFRELRARIMRIALYVVTATIAALFFYDQLFQLILDPYNQARELLGQTTQTQAVITGVGTPLMLQLKSLGIAALVATSPLWLYEIWGFIVPGLHSNERRWTRIFAFTAGPLFIAGVALGYYVLPKGIATLISFTPNGRHPADRVRRLLHLHHPDAAGLRGRLRDPAVRHHAQPRGGRLGQGPGQAPALDHHRHLHLRGGRDAVDGSLLDADAGPPDAGPGDRLGDLARVLDRRRGRRSPEDHNVTVLRSPSQRKSKGHSAAFGNSWRPVVSYAGIMTAKARWRAMIKLGDDDPAELAGVSRCGFRRREPVR